MEKRKEITLTELQELKKAPATMGLMAQVKVKGIATVFDKDGNVKFKMDIKAIEPEPED